jgi:hypothetical protein
MSYMGLVPSEHSSGAKKPSWQDHQDRQLSPSLAARVDAELRADHRCEPRIGQADRCAAAARASLRIGAEPRQTPRAFSSANTQPMQQYVIAWPIPVWPIPLRSACPIRTRPTTALGSSLKGPPVRAATIRTGGSSRSNWPTTRKQPMHSTAVANAASKGRTRTS